MTPVAREVRVPVAGTELFAREVGRGKPIVVLHGGPDFDHTYLLPELDRLADSHRLIYYDQRGRGRSAPETWPQDVTLQSEMDDLALVAEHFGLETFALLGHSWGALLAMEFAIRHPRRLSHLISMNSAPASHRDLVAFREQRRAAWAADLERMEAISATEAYRSGDLGAEAEYYRIHFGRTLSSPHLERVLARLRSHFAPADVLRARAIERRLYELTWNAPEYDLLPELGRVEVPTLVIHGDRDLIPAAGAARVAAAIPGARFALLEACGHFSYLERLEEVARLVAELLKEASSNLSGRCKPTS